MAASAGLTRRITPSGAVWAMPVTAVSKASLRRSRESSLSRQLITAAPPAAAANAAWMPDHRTGCARPAAWLKTALGSTSEPTMWWTSTSTAASPNGSQSS